MSQKIRRRTSFRNDTPFGPCSSSSSSSVPDNSLEAAVAARSACEGVDAGHRPPAVPVLFATSFPAGGRLLRDALVLQNVEIGNQRVVAPVKWEMLLPDEQRVRRGNKLENIGISRLMISKDHSCIRFPVMVDAGGPNGARWP
jgi:hypothetical protein